MLHYLILYHTILYSTLVYPTLPYSTLLYYTILYYTILVLYDTIRYYTILYHIVLGLWDPGSEIPASAAPKRASGISASERSLMMPVFTSVHGRRFRLLGVPSEDRHENLRGWRQAGKK